MSSGKPKLSPPRFDMEALEKSGSGESTLRAPRSPRTPRSPRECDAEDLPPQTPAVRTAAFPKRALDLEERRLRTHLQSADLFDVFSPVQKQRQDWKPQTPDALPQCRAVEVPLPDFIPDLEILERFPKLCKQKYVELEPDPLRPEAQTMRIGVVLSGGPAPGGHNVIAGIFDHLESQGGEHSKLVGFLAGLDGVFNSKYRVITPELMKRFRNQGGFDLLWSGRGKVKTDADFRRVKHAIDLLNLSGLVIIGGDGSNSNAALIAEWCAEHVPTCAVIGVPKTIDGDLKNEYVETTFGFDTAAKTYSELLGNLCTDSSTSKRTYHFVRVMGRSASHLALECGLQTRPNLVLIGEEIKAKNMSLCDVIKQISDLICERRAAGKHYGVILLPEGLIEFIPDFVLLIKEIEELTRGQEEPRLEPSELTPDSRRVWELLPSGISTQLLLEREASGYVQVAKIETEALLKDLVLAELGARGAVDGMTFQTHYFGYEGRCAMPSNFDAAYCYCLGQTAAALAAEGLTGFMAVIRHLDQNPEFWKPAGIPFPRIMEMKEISEGVKQPAITRALVDLEGGLFKVFAEAREHWRMKDLYRVPGPIQFEGPAADISNYTVSIPRVEDLLWGDGQETKHGEGRASFPKHRGALSQVQLQRLQHRLEVPRECNDPFITVFEGAQHFPKDPYTQRQALVYYQKLCSDNQFCIREFRSEPSMDYPVNRDSRRMSEPSLRIGILLLSRQAPGVQNILWGIHERVSLVGGVAIGFYDGISGLFERRFIEITSADLELYLNQGGSETLGRSLRHSLLQDDAPAKALASCNELRLDGLVIIGSSMAMVEAAGLAEYFLEEEVPTCVIGVPATSSNNMKHELIETSVGFDTSSKVYANLIGNILTEAASMPKYWHFVRLMGRSPSNEVLECALQTHPNFVIIAEEYGAAGKSLADVVDDIADLVQKRAIEGKQFGSVLIPDSLLIHLPHMRMLMGELRSLVTNTQSNGRWPAIRKSLLSLIGGGPASPPRIELEAEASDLETIRTYMSTWTLSFFAALPAFIRRALLQLDGRGQLRTSSLQTEVLLAQMVKEELQRRSDMTGDKIVKFQYQTHFFGYQGRSSMPSPFDAKLAFTYGHLAVMCIEKRLTGFCCTVRGLCGESTQWKLSALPMNCLMLVVPSLQELDSDLIEYQKNSTRGDRPIIPPAEVSVNCKSFRWMKTALERWEMQDRFCNPGPIQFEGAASEYYHRTLHEEQADYFKILTKAQEYSAILKETLTFGIEEHYLKSVFVHLNALLTMRFHPDELTNFVIPFADLEKEKEEGEPSEVAGWPTSALRPSGSLVTPMLRSATTNFGPAVTNGLRETATRSQIGFDRTGSLAFGSRPLSASLRRNQTMMVGGGRRSIEAGMEDYETGDD